MAVKHLNFCDKLKKARQRVGLTQQQIANALGITKSTYCGYETGKRQPDIPKLRRLSLLLCTPVDELLGLSASEAEFSVSPSEFELIKLYRSLDAHGQRLTRILLDEENARLRAQMREIPACSQEEEVVTLPLASEAVTCEPGAYLGPDGFTTISLRREAAVGAAFALPVRGSSLLPRFRDQDVLLVSSVRPAPGDVGVFMQNGKCFVRLTGYSELLSINPSYAPMLPDESVRPCGTVIGVLSKNDLL